MSAPVRAANPSFTAGEASEGVKNPSITAATMSKGTTAPRSIALSRPANISESARRNLPGRNSDIPMRSPVPQAIKMAASSNTPCGSMYDQ